ncbi:MAG: ATP-binding protein [Sphingobacteriales bacterium]|jgi:predicted AAA+ superfamily ATPase
MAIKRTIQERILQRMHKNKAILIFGARQTGKSTLSEALIQKQEESSLSLNGDDSDVRALFQEANATKLRAIIGNHKIVLIDEAQRIQDIGLAIKIIVDQIKNVQVIATGSSSFDLASKINESLTGRKYEFQLFPFSFGEMVSHHGLLEEKRMIDHRMLYGYYPEVVTHPGEEEERLKLLASSYLYKDLLMLDKINKPAMLEKLVQALAWQVGSEVSLDEISRLLAIDRKTVEKYIDLLEKAFVIFQVPAFSQNVRTEIRKGKKIYFCDCGIRNAVINHFQPVVMRPDKGALWENFVMAERLKFLRNQGKDTKLHFWRTTQQQEIDLIESDAEKLNAIEIKYNPAAKAKFSSTFTGAYPHAQLINVNSTNIESFLL